MVEPMAMSRSELPLDLLPRIVSFLDSPHDIYQLCLVCRKFVFYCREALYDGSRFRCCKPDFGSRTDDYRRVGAASPGSATPMML
ncbi:uncharacterized protein EI90DRAFT_3068048, partial [Cantharellus anzutake]|uniref:uncharacterized protein n=1 Tax=Cantharellus anzutake TaxID=1750568 RepID=UPI001906CFB2